ncbi:LOW QUALITY PROTEIN: hypothetical protein QYF61_003067, partial [Mycteria americana]
MLAGLDPLVILYMPCDGTQDDLLHQLSQYRGRRLLFFLSSSQSSLFSQAGLPPRWLVCRHLGTAHSCAFRTSSLKNVQPSWTPLPFRAASQGTLSTSLLKRPKSALRKSKVPVLLTPLAASPREVLQPSDHFCCPPLDPLQQLPVLLVLRAPELDAILQVRSHQSGVEGQNHLPRPAGHASFDAAQDMVGLLGCEHTLLAHVQLFVHQYPQVLSCRAALDHIIPQPVLKPRIVLTQDPALGLVEPHEVHTGPLLQLVQVPLDDLLSFRRVNCTTQLGVICKLAEGALDLTVNVIDENIEQRWSQYGPLRDTTRDEDAKFYATTHEKTSCFCITWEDLTIKLSKNGLQGTITCGVRNQLVLVEEHCKAKQVLGPAWERLVRSAIPKGRGAGAFPREMAVLEQRKAHGATMDVMCSTWCPLLKHWAVHAIL